MREREESGKPERYISIPTTQWKWKIGDDLNLSAKQTNKQNKHKEDPRGWQKLKRSLENDASLRRGGFIPKFDMWTLYFSWKLYRMLGLVKSRLEREFRRNVQACNSWSSLKKEWSQRERHLLIGKEVPAKKEAQPKRWSQSEGDWRTLSQGNHEWGSFIKRSRVEWSEMQQEDQRKELVPLRSPLVICATRSNMKPAIPSVSA